MSETIPSKEKYELIENAYKNGKLCLFIGAGISNLAGCPTWTELCQAIIKDEQIGTNDFQYKESLKKETDNKKLLTVIYKLFEDKREDKEEAKKSFFNIIKTHLESKEKKHDQEKDKNIYKIIQKLQNVLKITTNADKVIDKYLKGLREVTYKDFTSDKLPLIENSSSRNKLNQLFKIHGTVSPQEQGDYEQLIFTTPNYLKRYKDLEFIKFLKDLFEQYTVLFIGYGLKEFELLQYALPEKELTKKHFLLKGYCSFEKIEKDFDEIYLEELGIELIDFNHDKLGYEQLIVVLEKWVNSLLIKDFAIARETIKKSDISFEEINALLIEHKVKEKYDTQEQIFRDALNHVPKETYLKWLEGLKRNGFLEPQNFMKIGLSKDEEGKDWASYSSLFTFLIKINKEPSQKSDTDNLFIELVDSFIDFLKDKKDKQEEVIYNPNSRACLIEIICNFELEQLSEKHIEFLGEKYLSRSTISIKEKLLPKLLKKDSEPKLFFCFIKSVLLSSSVDQLSIEKLLENYYSKIINKDREKLIDICEERINFIEKESTSKNSNLISFWAFRIRKIIKQQKPDSKYRDSDFFEKLSVYFLYMTLLEQSTDYLKNKVQEYLKKDKSIYQRIAIFVINHKYDELKDLLWNLPFNPFINYSIKPEFFILLQNHQDLNTEEVDKFFSWLDEYDLNKKFYNEEDEAQKEEIRAYQRQLKIVLLQKEDKTFCNQKLADEYKKLAEKTGKDKWSKEDLDGSLIGEVKLYTINEVHIAETLDLGTQLSSKNSVKEVLEYIKNYKPSEDELKKLKHNSFDWTSGLGEALENDIKQKPEKYLTKEIYEFLDSANFIQIETNSWDYDCSQKYTLSLFIESLQSLNLLELVSEEEIQCLLVFLEELINSRETDSDDSLLRHISELLIKLINKSTLSNIEKLLLQCAEKTEDNKTYDHWKDEPLNGYLNAPRGVILDNLMQFVLEEAKIKESKLFNSNILDYFEKCLDSASTSDYPHLWCCLGLFFFYINSANKDWAEKNVNKIFPKDKDDKWYAAFYSYCYRAWHIGLNEKLSKVFIEAGHYDKAIKYQVLKEGSDFYRIIANQIASLSVLPKGDTELILLNDLISNGTNDLFKSFLGEFRVGRYSDSQKIDLKKIWQQCLDRLNKEEKKDTYLYLSLAEWIELIKDLDAGFEKLLRDTLELPLEKHSQIDDFYFLFESFAKLSEKSEEQAKFVADLWIFLIEHPYSRLINYPEEEIKQTLENIQKHSFREAESIKDIYKNRWDYTFS